MIEFYAQIKMVHVSMVLASGALFALRGAGVLAGHRWPRATMVRWTSYTIDTTLLTAALMLLTILPWAMFGNGWLAMKLALLVVYIVLGILALGPGRARGSSAGFYVAALATYAMVYGIARAHHPLGVLHAHLA
jgi:uncharacterized membrane protein SirB2